MKNKRYAYLFTAIVLLSHTVISTTVTAETMEETPSSEKVEKNEEEVTETTEQQETLATNEKVDQPKEETTESESKNEEVDEKARNNQEVRLEDWVTEDKGSYVLITKYTGRNPDIIVPNEIRGKSTKLKEISSAVFPTLSSATSFTILPREDGTKVGVESTNFMNVFSKNRTLKTINLTGLDTSKVTNMNSMFFQCANLTSIDISNWDTSNVTTMSFMFTGCANLTSIDVSNWDTSKVTTMQRLFSDCANLTSIDISNWDTSKVTIMSGMFTRCANLTSIDISNWDTSAVYDMRYMFSLCSNLTSIDISNWDTSKVTNMETMFSDCANLTSIDISNWDTSKVTVMQGMFTRCNNLTSIDISNWDTSVVYDMRWMFYHCANLISIDVSNWDTRQTPSKNMENMFTTLSTTPLTVVATDSKLLRYNYDKDNRTSGRLLLNANGGIFRDGSIEKNYFTSCAIKPEETSLDKLEAFKQNNLPTKTGASFNGYKTITDTSKATSVLDLIGTVYEAQWKVRNASLKVPTTISFGTHKLSKGTNYYAVDTIEGNELSVTDDRGIGSKWQLTAKLETFFTNNEKSLPNSLIYKISTGEETIIENAAQVIATHTTSTDSDETTISDNWTNTQGLMLKIREGKAYVGEYTGTIEWTLNDTP